MINSKVMMKSSDILPMYPGYALGGIIREEDLLLPLYEKKRLNIEECIAKLVEEKDKEKESVKYKLLGDDTKQEILSNFVTKIIREQKRHVQVCKAIEQLLNSEDESPLVDEALPLDDSKVKLKNENRSFKSERMDYLIFTSKDQVLNRMQTFVSQLFAQSAASTILPFGTLEAMAKNIEHMLGTSNTAVTLIGSFITLERVKIIEPLVIRSHTYLSSDLINRSAKYYVLSEAVLGAVFLGLGKALSVVGKELEDEEKEKKWLSSLATISFVSQGAIPKLNYKFEEVSLWSVYNNWKEILSSDVDSGYPIGFKVRRLQDILMENNILVPEENLNK